MCVRGDVWGGLGVCEEGMWGVREEVGGGERRWEGVGGGERGMCGVD